MYIGTTVFLVKQLPIILLARGTSTILFQPLMARIALPLHILLRGRPVQLFLLLRQIPTCWSMIFRKLSRQMILSTSRPPQVVSTPKMFLGQPPELACQPMPRVRSRLWLAITTTRRKTVTQPSSSMTMERKTRLSRKRGVMQIST